MAERHQISVPDTTIAYTDHGGDGPPTLLVHGITERQEVWDPIVERLCADRQVFTMDIRGHGRSGTAADYAVETIAGDVVAVMTAMGTMGRTHLVGHSLGGMVVSTVAAGAPVASVVNVDQSLDLAAFTAQIIDFGPMLRDELSFPTLMETFFAMLAGERIDEAAIARVNDLRVADQDVVLGVWNLLLTATPDEVDTIVADVLSTYADRDVPYLTIFGADPGPHYEDWLARFIPGAVTEVWDDHGHYPHLVDPDRFVARLRAFWSA